MHFPDMDECSQPEPVCTEEHQECINTKGSYVCICSSGYEEQDGKCVQTVQPGEHWCCLQTKTAFCDFCSLYSKDASGSLLNGAAASQYCQHWQWISLILYLFFYSHQKQRVSPEHLKRPQVHTGSFDVKTTIDGSGSERAVAIFCTSEAAHFNIVHNMHLMQQLHAATTAASPALDHGWKDKKKRHFVLLAVRWSMLHFSGYHSMSLFAVRF